ncbi:MAG TPA: hypothetical protein VJR26_13455, partial [Candidatus Acidoferrales bacterium]|nr:hypothetical protein [Candidatus Acidoferrales bacterium]
MPELPEQLFVSVKSLALEPATEMLLTTSAPFPELVTVIVTAELGVPAAWLPKLTAVVDRLKSGWIAVPVNVTVWGLPSPSSAMLRAALRVPGDIGSKVTFMTQFAF